MIEPGADQSADAGDPDDQKAFVFVAAFNQIGTADLQVTPVKIRLQDVRGDEQGDSNHQPEGGDFKMAEVKKRNHAFLSAESIEEYT